MIIISIQFDQTILFYILYLFPERVEKRLGAELIHADVDLAERVWDCESMVAMVWS